METQQIIVRDEKGELVKLSAEVCHACGAKVWPDVQRHLDEFCSNVTVDIDVRCKHCKRVVRTIPGTKQQKASNISTMHVPLCDLCRRKTTIRRRRRATSPKPIYGI